MCILIEVSIYSTVSAFFTGWDTSPCFYLIAIIPVIIYFGHSLFEVGTWRIPGIHLILIVTLYFSLYLILGDEVPVFLISDNIKTVLILVSSATMIVSMIFYSVIHIYSNDEKTRYLKAQNDQLITDALTDSLTGLFNRRGFMPLLNAAMKENRHFCIALFDIDDFKKINDSYGHDAGDEILRHASRLVKKEMQGCNICRWGGEEFVIMMQDYDFEVAKHKMEYIRDVMAKTGTNFYNKKLYITITIGLEVYADANYNDAFDIIKTADKRMYYGKQHGKNVVISQ